MRTVMPIVHNAYFIGLSFTVGPLIGSDSLESFPLYQCGTILDSTYYYHILKFKIWITVNYIILWELSQWFRIVSDKYLAGVLCAYQNTPREKRTIFNFLLLLFTVSPLHFPCINLWNYSRIWCIGLEYQEELVLSLSMACTQSSCKQHQESTTLLQIIKLSDAYSDLELEIYRVRFPREEI